MKSRIRLRVRRREPINMLWERLTLDKRIAAAAEKLKEKQKASRFFQNPHSA